jgi:hypothetical protein
MLTAFEIYQNSTPTGIIVIPQPGKEELVKRSLLQVRFSKLSPGDLATQITDAVFEHAAVRKSEALEIN